MHWAHKKLDGIHEDVYQFNNKLTPEERTELIEQLDSQQMIQKITRLQAMLEAKKSE
ncbi:MAG: hypothetical protein WA432_03870 [Candidatus Babeliaceae bacterium]